MSPLHKIERLGKLPKDIKRQPDFNKEKGAIFNLGGGLVVDENGKITQLFIGEIPKRVIQQAKEDKIKLYLIKPAFDPQKRTKILESENPPDGTLQKGIVHHKGESVGRYKRRR